MMISHGSDEWRFARLGIPTGSEMHRLMPAGDAYDIANGKSIRLRRKKEDGEKSSAWLTFNAEKLTERICLCPARGEFVSDDMQHGIDTENEAIIAYEMQTGFVVERGYWVDMGSWGCTPDGLVLDEGILSIKCPKTSTFVWERFYNHAVCRAYYWQIVAEMAATGRKWGDLAFYDPRIPDEGSRLYIRRIERDDDSIERMLSEIKDFTDLLDAKCAALGVPWPPVEVDDATRYLLAG